MARGLESGHAKEWLCKGEICKNGPIWKGTSSVIFISCQSSPLFQRLNPELQQ